MKYLANWFLPVAAICLLIMPSIQFLGIVDGSTSISTSFLPGTSITPNPTALGQQITIIATISPSPPAGYSYHGIWFAVIDSNGNYRTVGTNSTQPGTGTFIFSWTPDITGKYQCTLTYPGETLEGNTYTQCQSDSSFFVDGSLPTIAPTPIQTSTPPTPSPAPTASANSNSYFQVESNSTITGLFFNSTSSALSFTVTGPTGTNGYVQYKIAKSLLTSVQNVKVYLDGSQLNVNITSDENSWLLYFTYHHSSHNVVIDLSQQSSVVPKANALIWIALPIVIAALLISVAAIALRRKKQNKIPPFS